MGKLAIELVIYQAVNMFVSGIQLGILTWGCLEIDSLL